MEPCEEGSDASLHVFMVSFPGQGHVSPLLRLANCLASKGLLVTFSTTESFGKEMRKANDNNISDDRPISAGNGAIRFEFFDDEGWDYKSGLAHNPELYFYHLEVIGKEKLTHMLKKQEEQGRPVCCVVNNPFVPWASEVAESLGIPNAVLWVQSCACFVGYFHYHQGLVPFPSEEEPELDVQLPCMPLLKYDEVPSFLHPSSPYGMFSRAILGQFKNLSKTSSCILMDTFQELEHELIEYMSSKACPIKPIGPMFKNPAALCANIRGDMMKADDCCIEWLDSRPPSSVAYISFGTIVHLEQEQIDEIAYGLLSSEVSFLWVIKPGIGHEPHVLPDGFLEKVGEKGKFVQWCPQAQVLAHPSVACFLTHCGWNSTMEALACGVPLLAFPQWGDQVTNAKYIVDVFKVGIQLCRGRPADQKKIIPRDEIDKCLVEATSGPQAAEIKENALKWRKKAEEAIADSGSSTRNIQNFVDELSAKSNKK